jgi:hypothetical protein
MRNRSDLDLEIYVPTFRFIVHLQVISDKDELSRINNEILSFFEDSEPSFGVRGRAYAPYISADGRRTCRVLIDAKHFLPGVIAHEIMHVVFFILGYIDVPLSQESEEVYTCLNEYLIESVYNECGNRLFKNTKA